ncbi:hypothetical protein OSB04_012889 [Centaurea solstitialis]|uniref:Uncharacterized protein n=1 Tax=Centaurea solstitialis TaxID=347529 RepID=A0AA38WMU7_9ASTR|nr:hypothetical protein OSB04_012889 [Centaurea solstitialis]
MAFHVACPITCRRICYCSLGFPQARNGFLEEIAKLKEFLDDPWLIRDGKRTVQVLVPKVEAVAPPPPKVAATVAVADAEEMLSAQNKRAALQRKAAAASLVAEDYARRFESGDTVDTAKDLAGEEQALSNAKVMCRLCFSGESERSEKTRRMLSCKSCKKKYHRSCLKAWAHDRDLFHWSSWSCPSCRICEVCRRNGDPNKLMFCKRCDGAYHCYCQHPPHKNVSRGPYLCPKHTKCHSCESTVPGNGLSLRWFLGYTCCDACGRLFVKEKYCPVCLKVYRDSESTPMVCCDICQRWVHCHCDGISDEKYLQYQVDNHLQYVCAACRGDCYQVRDQEDAVQELWRRRDKAEKDLIASLRAAAGLPTQEEIFSISPYSDEEDDGPALKKEYGHSLKFSLKGIVDKSPKKSKEYVKKSANKKHGKEKGFPAPVFGRIEQRIEGYSDGQSIGSIMGDNKDEDVQSHRNVELNKLSFPVTGSLTGRMMSVNRTEGLKHKLANEVPVKTERRTFREKMKDSRPYQMPTVGDSGKEAVKSKNTKGPKLVIHLGARNKNVANSPRSDASNSLQAEPNLRVRQSSSASVRMDCGGRRLSPHFITLSSRKNCFPHFYSLFSRISYIRPYSSALFCLYFVFVLTGGEEMVQQRANENRLDLHDSTSKLSDVDGHNLDRADEIKGPKLRAKDRNVITMKNPNPNPKHSSSVSHSSQKELKPSFKLKFKNPYSGDQSSWAPLGEEDKSLVKGQRSKRKRPPPSMEKSSSVNEDKGSGHDKDMMSEIMDAKWVIQKLGKHAIGKMVEVLQPSNNSWHKGSVTEVSEDTSTVMVSSDDGKAITVDLATQGIRFVSQKHRQ